MSLTWSVETCHLKLKLKPSTANANVGGDYKHRLWLAIPHAQIPLMHQLRPILEEVQLEPCPRVLHGPIHLCVVGVAYRPGVPRDGICRQQLFDHSGLGFAGCVPQPPEPVVAELGDGHLSGPILQFSGGGVP